MPTSVAYCSPSSHSLPQVPFGALCPPPILTQSQTSALYTQPPFFEKFQYPITRHLGFLIDIPHRPPVATPWYFGENTHVGRRELVFRSDPEYFASDGIIPYITDSIPLVNMEDPSYSFSREEHTFRL
jgi:hypothetical protein